MVMRSPESQTSPSRVLVWSRCGLETFVRREDAEQLLAHRDVELSVLLSELDDYPVASEICGFKVPEVNVRFPGVILAVAVLAQCACGRGLVRHQAAIELPPLDENRLVEVVV